MGWRPDTSQRATSMRTVATTLARSDGCLFPQKRRGMYRAISCPDLGPSNCKVIQRRCEDVIRGEIRIAVPIDVDIE